MSQQLVVSGYPVLFFFMSEHIILLSPAIIPLATPIRKRKRREMKDKH